MICRNCGTENPDDALTCYVCGEAPNYIKPSESRTNESMAYSQGSQALRMQTPYEEKSSVKTLIIAIVAILLVAAAAYVFLVLKPFEKVGKPEDMVQECMDTLFSTIQPEKIEKYMPPYVDVNSDDWGTFSTGMAAVKAMGFTVSAEAGEYTKYSNSEIDSYRRRVESSTGYKGRKIKEVGTVELTIHVSGSYGGQTYSESETGEAVVVRIGNKWYISEINEKY